MHSPSGVPHSQSLKRAGGEGEGGERKGVEASLPHLAAFGCTDAGEATMLWKLVENVKYEDIYEVTSPSSCSRRGKKKKGLAGFMERALKGKC